jgi:hypothetical protein
MLTPCEPEASEQTWQPVHALQREAEPMTLELTRGPPTDEDCAPP